MILGDFGILRIFMGILDMVIIFIGILYYMSFEVFKYEGYKYKLDIWYIIYFFICMKFKY